MSESDSLDAMAWSSLMRGVDPLFMSLAWREHWWTLWGAVAGEQVTLSCADREGPLAIAPLYKDRVRLLAFFSYVRLQLMGCSYGTLSTPRAEYNSFLLRDTATSNAFQALAERLEAISWQEMVLQDVIVGSAMDVELHAWCQRRRWGLREILRDQAYAVGTGAGFDRYLASLGSSTRLKLFNRRKLLATLGAVQINNLFPQRVDEFFDLLNGFHRTRWGCDCFGPESLSFHKRLIQSLADQGADIDLSLLALDGKPLSVLYNVRCGDRVYNLQSGYLESFHPKISLGTLHLGYAIEAAFACPDALHFDMLAGRGKQTDYKRAIADEVVSLWSYKIVRSPFLRALYRVKSWKDAHQKMSQ